MSIFLTMAQREKRLLSDSSTGISSVAAVVALLCSITAKVTQS